MTDATASGIAKKAKHSTVGAAPMEKVERTNIVIVCLNQQAGFTSQYNPYVMDVNRRNINCYNYRGFGHMVRNCRNRRIGDRIGEERRLEYKDGNNRHKRMTKGGNRQNQNNNLNRE